MLPTLGVVFDTLSNSRKAQNLFANPACSMVLWSGATTVQFEGTANEYLPAVEGEHKETYLRAHPGGHERLKWPLLIYFVVTPTWIRYSDYRQHPPIIEEFRFSAAEDGNTGEAEGR